MRPEYVNCVDCGEPIKVGARGRLPTRHRKQYENRPCFGVTRCTHCEVECTPTRKRKLPYCDECVESGKARRDTSLRSGYGITLRQYEALWEVQGGRCGICEKDLLTVHAVCTDHDHETGKVRGILCHHCNRALGAFGDNLEGIRKVMRYLERPPMSDTS